MPQVDPVILQLRADIESYQANVSKAQRLSDQKLDSIERRADKMGAGVNRAFSFAAKSALAYAGTLATINTARELLRITDEAKNIEAQLKLATREFGSFGQAQEDVRRIAAVTRSELGSTAQLYATFQRNAAQLGVTQEQTARATETVTKSFQISGATAEEAAGGLRQFLQGLQSGTLRGEELNSVLENAPRLAKLLADSLGVTIGQLRLMGQAGELSADKLIAALTNRKYTAEIDAEFKELPVTFDQAMQQVENAAIITFGAFDRGGQFSTALSTFILDGTTGFADLETKAEQLGITLRATFEGLGDAFDPLLEGALSVFGSIDDASKSLADRIRPLLGEIDAISGWVGKQGLAGRLITGGSVKDWWNERPTRGTTMLRDFNKGYDRAYADLALQKVYRGDPFADFPSIAPPKPTATPQSTAKKGGSGKSAEAAARRAENERLRAIRDDAAAQRDSTRLDSDILAAKEALATAADDILRYQLDSIELARRQANTDIETDVRLGNLGREEADRRVLINNELAGLHEQLVKRRADEARAQAQAAQTRDSADTLRAESRLAKTRAERADIEKRILDLQYQEEESAIRRAAANGQIADLDLALSNLKRRQLADEEMLRRNNLSPGQSYLKNLQDEAANLGDAYENIAVRGLERMNQAFADNIKSALGLHGVMGDIIGDFIELAIRQQVLGPLASAIFGGVSLFGGGTSAVSNPSLGLGSLTNGRLSGARASGGPVSAGSAYLVGENGPEVLRMGSQGGFVVPNHQLVAGGGGSTVVQQFHFDVRGAVVTQDLINQMNEIGARATVAGAQLGAGQAEGRIMSRSRRRIPG